VFCKLIFTSKLGFILETSLSFHVPEIRDETRTGESVVGAGGVGGGERPDSAERKAGEETDGDLEIPRNQRLEVRPGTNVIKLFTAVIYCLSTVIPSFCVIK
jgi:hypothetical protein